MRVNLQAWGDRALRIASIGLTLGAIAAVPALAGGGVPGVLGLAGILFWGIVLVPTLALAVLVANDFTDGQGKQYISTAFAYGSLLLQNLAGAGLALVFFYVLASNAPVYLARLDASALRLGMDNLVGWNGVAAVLGAAAVGALAVATWAHVRAAD